jgi:hypothetical protein
MTRAAFAAGAAVLLLMMAAVPVSASSTQHLSGGGTATISQVAFNVTIEGSAASGSFNCLMAGRSAGVLSDFGLFHLMKVQAEPTVATVTGSRVSFSGPGFLIMDGSTKMRIHVSVWADVATQEFRLAVLELGAAGLMPPEKMLTGNFELR